MKNFTYLTLFILLFLACTTSESSSTTKSTMEVAEEITDLELVRESGAEAKEDISENITGEMINPNLLVSESQPYDITSYFKFYVKDIEEAKRVLTTKWDPNDSPGTNENYEDQLDILNIKDGYMKIVTPVSDGFVFTEYVYWNLSDGRKLFAMNNVSMEPFTGEVTTDKFEFRVFDENGWERADLGFFQNITDEIDTRIPEEVINSEILLSIFDLPKETTPETHFSFKLSLPQKGKDISFWLNYSEGADVVSSEKINLKFNDGKFEYQP